MRPFIALIHLSNITFSQVLHDVPFASKGNTLELTIASVSASAASQLSIEAVNPPSWISFVQQRQMIDVLKANQEKAASFSFSIDKLAPVNKEQSLIFAIRSKSGESWTKEITIVVSPPDRFELFQNYPNPFNPRTTVGYQLSANSRVSLKVFNMPGQEVVTLAEGDKAAGYHQETFEANRFASGMYVYRIVATDQSGKQASARKTTLVVK